MRTSGVREYLCTSILWMVSCSYGASGQCSGGTTCDTCTRIQGCGWCVDTISGPSSISGKCDLISNLEGGGCVSNQVLTSSPGPMSTFCEYHGYLSCDGCVCNPGYFGDWCQCGQTDDNVCKMRSDSPVCSGRGQCVCGECECDAISVGQPTKKYVGRFCECDNYNCDYSHGKLCGGPTRGRCVCGKCACESGYEGVDCSCSTNTDSCLSTNGEVCNGQGECRCGQCSCFDSYYRGATCEDCPTCEGRCKLNKECVQCKVFSSGPYDEEKCERDCQGIAIVPRIDYVEYSAPDWLPCRFRDEDDCVFNFVVRSTGVRSVVVQLTKECPRPPGMEATGSGASRVRLIGLLSCITLLMSVGTWIIL